MHPVSLKDLEPKHVTLNRLLNNDVVEARRGPCVSDTRRDFILYILTLSLKTNQKASGVVAAGKLG